MGKKIRRAKKWLRGYDKSKRREKYYIYCKKKLFENYMQNYFYADTFRASIEAYWMIKNDV